MKLLFNFGKTNFIQILKLKTNYQTKLLSVKYIARSTAIMLEILSAYFDSIAVNPVGNWTALIPNLS